MTDNVRLAALELLAEVAALAPDVRLGQLFSHLGFLGQAHLDRGLGYLDDDELRLLQHHRDELLARSPNYAEPRQESVAVGG